MKRLMIWLVLFTTVARPTLAQDNVLLAGGMLATSIPVKAVWKITATASDGSNFTVRCADWKGRSGKLDLYDCYQRKLIEHTPLIFHYKQLEVEGLDYTISKAR